jgi:ABC-type transport system involved in cytochrome bd biosynthesis fused ATPase/permease subunit
VIKGGQIVEQGTHQDLMEQNGAYARYWSHQSAGFIAQDPNRRLGSGPIDFVGSA